MNFKLEVIAFDIESCFIAQKCGATRIELCDNQGEGGTTPSQGFINQAREKISIELFPIIRPRGGDFLYTGDEFEIMKTDVVICKEMGCDGIVTGILNSDGSVDKKRMKVLTNLAYPMSVTFHRAFDRTNDAFKALEDIIEIGCERILTSGQKPTAMEGIDLIEALVNKADNRIIIMPGSGIKSDNIIEIAQKTKAQEFHSSARNFISSKMEYHQESMNENLKQVQLNEKEVLNLLSNLASIKS
jgi:copper homeostasis protein